MTAVVDQLRRAREASGLTQRAVAEAMGTTQSAIARLEAGGTSPRLSTLEAYGWVVGRHLELAGRDLLVDAASAIRASLSSGDHDASLRALLQLAADTARLGDPVAGLRPEPPPTGDRRWDAALAACVAWTARRHGVPPPAWSAAPSKYLDGPWFVVADVLGRPVTASLAAYLLSVAPADFFGRGVIIDAATLETV